MPTESKFLVTHQQIALFRSAVAGLVSKDPKTDELGSYPVRSLYFDTPNYDFYLSKVRGETIRRKIRFRTYESDFVRLEFKIKEYGRVRKETFAMTRQQAESLIAGSEEIQHPVAQEFLRIRKLYSLRPTTLICYRREAYRLKVDPTIRITLDTDLRFGIAKSLYSQNVVWRKYPTPVLEIKSSADIPKNLSGSFSRMGLMPFPFSKYATSIESAAAFHD